MKKLSVIGFVLILVLSSVYAEVNTAYVEIRRRAADGPWFVEDIRGHKHSQESSGGSSSVNRWQRGHKAAQVIDYKPEIKDGALAGWYIFWVPSKKPMPIVTGYLEAEAPFLVPDEIDINSLLHQSWGSVSKTIAQILKRIQPVTKLRPIAFNYGVSDLRQRIVYGIWYSYYDVHGEFFTNEAGRESYRNRERRHDRVGEFSELHNLELPIPSILVNRPGIIQPRMEEYAVKVTTEAPALDVTTRPPPAKAEGETVTMAPFRTFSEWMDLLPVKNIDGTLKAIRVVNVTKGSPASSAGIVEGSMITSIQGIQIAGLTESEFSRRVLSAPMGEALRVELVQKDGTPLSVSIPR